MSARESASTALGGDVAVSGTVPKCTVHKGAWASSCHACEAVRAEVVARKGSWSLGDSGEIDAGAHWMREATSVRRRDEAMAWRITAATAAKAPAPDFRINLVTPVLAATGDDFELVARMERRVYQHTLAVRGSPAWETYSRETMDECCLFALFLALECEDEARELTAKSARSAKHSTKGSLLKRGGPNA